MNRRPEDDGLRSEPASLRSQLKSWLQFRPTMNVLQQLLLRVPSGLHFACAEELLGLVAIKWRVKPVALADGRLRPTLDWFGEHNDLRGRLSRAAPTGMVRFRRLEADGAQGGHPFFRQAAPADGPRLVIAAHPEYVAILDVETAVGCAH